MSLPMAKKAGWVRWAGRLGKVSLIMIVGLLLWWTFGQVPIKQVWTALRRLNPAQLAVWMSINIGLVALMAGRWGLILWTLRQRAPFLALIRYRLASFAVSYFTPGPQFGGEPVQVLALRQKHDVPGTTGTASVGLDRLLDLITNFSFLVFGVVIALGQTLLPAGWGDVGLLFGLGLLAFPLAYLVLMLIGWQPLNRLVDHLPQVIAKNWISDALRHVEVEMSALCVDHPWTVLKASLLSIGIWVGMVCEYWLLTYFLGLRLSFMQVISALTAARLAFLTPIPAGLGVLEASQVLALQVLGVAPYYGISIALLIRFRDIFFALIGLMVAFSLLRKPGSQTVRNPKDR